jgi:predicted RNA-binding protein associated with RNAse of E/G family
VIAPGSAVRVAKLNPEGLEVARYSAEVTDEVCPEPWLAVHATWTMKRVDAAGLIFEPGDTLIEYFSPAHWYNAFRVISPDGRLRGIYGNVTYPTSITSESGGTVVSWHDLYLDVLRLADGTVLLADEEELADSGLEETDPALFERIRSTADEMLKLAESGRFPFHTPHD